MNMLSINVNGKSVSADIQPRTHLADFLREKLNLTGTHLGCEHGVCGACTLLVDGVPTRSCITFALSPASRPRSPRSRGWMKTRSHASCAPPSPGSTACSAVTARRAWSSRRGTSCCAWMHRPSTTYASR